MLCKYRMCIAHSAFIIHQLLFLTSDLMHYTDRCLPRFLMHSQGLKFQALIFHPSSYLPGPKLLDTVKLNLQ